MATTGFDNCSPYGMVCSECNDSLIAPKWSAYVSKHEVRHFWSCRFQLSRVLPAGTDTASMIALNRTLYERARDIGGYRMTSSAVAMSQDDWKRHYGPAWQTVQAAKTKFDPKNVLTPGPGMFPD